MSEAKSIIDETSLREEAGDLHAFLLERLEIMLGLLEWLSVDLQKKGAVKKAEKIDQLAKLLDGFGNRAEKLERGFRDSTCAAMEDASPKALGDWAQQHEALRLDMAEFEKRITELTADEALVSEDDLADLASRLERLDAGIRLDEEALAVPPGP